MSDDVTVTPRSIAGEGRVFDMELGQRLGYSRPDYLRRLIIRRREEFESFGPLVLEEKVSTFQNGTRSRSKRTAPGRASLGFWLNEFQALLACVLSNAPNAPAVRRLVIDGFLAWKRNPSSPKKPDITLIYPDRPHDGAVPLAVILECVDLKAGEPVAPVDVDGVPPRRSPYQEWAGRAGHRFTHVPVRYGRLDWDVVSLARLAEERVKRYLLTATEVDPGWMTKEEMAWAAVQRPDLRFKLMENRLIACLPSARRDELRRIVLAHDPILELEGPRV